MITLFLRCGIFLFLLRLVFVTVWGCLFLAWNFIVIISLNLICYYIRWKDLIRIHIYWPCIPFFPLAVSSSSDDESQICRMRDRLEAALTFAFELSVFSFFLVWPTFSWGVPGISLSDAKNLIEKERQFESIELCRYSIYQNLTVGFRKCPFLNFRRFSRRFWVFLLFNNFHFSFRRLWFFRCLRFLRCFYFIRCLCFLRLFSRFCFHWRRTTWFCGRFRCEKRGNRWASRCDLCSFRSVLFLGTLFLNRWLLFLFDGDTVAGGSSVCRRFYVRAGFFFFDRSWSKQVGLASRSRRFWFECWLFFHLWDRYGTNFARSLFTLERKTYSERKIDYICVIFYNKMSCSPIGYMLMIRFIWLFGIAQHILEWKV